MTSEDRAFVWLWPPRATEPVLSGRLDPVRTRFEFVYGERYLANPDAIALYLPDMPLTDAIIMPTETEAPAPILDAAPDAWGRRVIENRLVGRDSNEDLGLLTYLLEPGSDRIGALDFTRSTEYEERRFASATLDEMFKATQMVEEGIPLPESLSEALLNGSSIGGARPKALLDDGDRNLIAKFSSTTDSYPVVQAEFIAMELARRVGLNVAIVNHARALDKDVVLIERFDRTPEGGRRMMVSGTTMLGLDPFLGARYGSYANLADLIIRRFVDAENTLHELFARIVFNILVGNTDDHLRNHAAFWDGSTLTLTPAFDITPQQRSGGMTRQAMAIGVDGFRDSQLAGAVARSAPYHLTEREARDVCDRQIEVIERDWNDVCDLAHLSQVERSRLWGRQFFNSYGLDGY